MQPIGIKSSSLVSDHAWSVDELFSLWCAAQPRMASKICLEEVDRKLRASQKLHLRHADPAVKLAVLAAQALTKPDENAAVVCASSRGATSLWETQHERFLRSGDTASWSSPHSTMGHFASSIALELSTTGFQQSISGVCVGGLHAVGLGAQLIATGFASEVICGGAEFADTPFTLAQLRAAKVLDESGCAYRPFSADRKGLQLGSGASLVHLSREVTSLAITGYGAATERQAYTAISEDAQALKKAIRQALAMAKLSPADIDFVMTHGAGTQRGDLAECAAYTAIFGDDIPLVCNKWLTHHLLGASSSTALVLATKLMTVVDFPQLPYCAIDPRFHLMPPKREVGLVAGLGFGGNAGALIVQKLG